MASLLSGLFLLLIYYSAYAQEPKDVPTTVGAIGVVIFFVIFVGLIVGFFAYYLWIEKKRNQDEKGHKE